MRRVGSRGHFRQADRHGGKSGARPPGRAGPSLAGSQAWRDHWPISAHLDAVLGRNGIAGVPGRVDLDRARARSVHSCITVSLPRCTLIPGYHAGFGISELCTEVALAALLVPSGGTTLALLDRETRAFHAEADRGWVRLLRDSSTTRDDYLQQLTVTYGFESSFEAACSYTPGVGQAIDLRGRWRSGLLAQDLLTLGSTAHDVEAMRCYFLAPFQDAAEALAWMYVVERPTSIHEDVRDELVSRFVDFSRATTYLGAYEGAVSRRRAELGIALDQLCVSDKVCKRVIEAARAGFQSLIEWQRTSNPLLRNVG